MNSFSTSWTTSEVRYSLFRDENDRIDFSRNLYINQNLQNKPKIVRRKGHIHVIFTFITRTKYEFYCRSSSTCPAAYPSFEIFAEGNTQRGREYPAWKLYDPRPEGGGKCWHQDTNHRSRNGKDGGVLVEGKRIGSEEKVPYWRANTFFYKK